MTGAIPAGALHAVPVDAASAAAWDEIAATSPDAWFWHTTDWLRFVKALGAAAFVDDRSFFLYQDRELLAICPLIVEAREGYRRFTYLGEFLPGAGVRARRRCRHPRPRARLVRGLPRSARGRARRRVHEDDRARAG